jgi:hypothetical protein
LPSGEPKSDSRDRPFRHVSPREPELDPVVLPESIFNENVWTTGTSRSHRRTRRRCWPASLLLVARRCRPDPSTARETNPETATGHQLLMQLHLVARRGAPETPRTCAAARRPRDLGLRENYPLSVPYVRPEPVLANVRSLV